MAEALPQTIRAALDDPFAQLAGPLAGTRRLDLEVVSAAGLTPHLRGWSSPARSSRGLATCPARM